MAAEEPAAGQLPPAGTDLGLTARELEVLQHLARGATNRRIADALYISARPAGVHVSHILGKLDAANRGEAAAIAHRLGLAP
jgi:DNA-binding CsgD family transcriptional regulator